QQSVQVRHRVVAEFHSEIPNRRFHGQTPFSTSTTTMPSSTEKFKGVRGLFCAHSVRTECARPEERACLVVVAAAARARAAARQRQLASTIGPVGLLFPPVGS